MCRWELRRTLCTFGQSQDLVCIPSRWYRQNCQVSAYTYWLTSETCFFSISKEVSKVTLEMEMEVVWLQKLSSPSEISHEITSYSWVWPDENLDGFNPNWKVPPPFPNWKCFPNSNCPCPWYPREDSMIHLSHTTHCGVSPWCFDAVLSSAKCKLLCFGYLYMVLCFAQQNSEIDEPTSPKAFIDTQNIQVCILPS